MRAEARGVARHHGTGTARGWWPQGEGSRNERGSCPRERGWLGWGLAWDTCGTSFAAPEDLAPHVDAIHCRIEHLSAHSHAQGGSRQRMYVLTYVCMYVCARGSEGGGRTFGEGCESRTHQQPREETACTGPLYIHGVWVWGGLGVQGKCKGNGTRLPKTLLIHKSTRSFLLPHDPKSGSLSMGIMWNCRAAGEHGKTTRGISPGHERLALSRNSTRECPPRRIIATLVGL